LDSVPHGILNQANEKLKEEEYGSRLGRRLCHVDVSLVGSGWFVQSK